MIPTIKFPKPGVGWVLHASDVVVLRGCLVLFLVESGAVLEYRRSLLFLVSLNIVPLWSQYQLGA